MSFRCFGGLPILCILLAQRFRSSFLRIRPSLNFLLPIMPIKSEPSVDSEQHTAIFQALLIAILIKFKYILYSLIGKKKYPRIHIKMVIFLRLWDSQLKLKVHNTMFYKTKPRIQSCITT